MTSHPEFISGSVNKTEDAEINSAWLCGTCGRITGVSWRGSRNYKSK